MAYTDIIAQLAVSLDLDSGGFVRKTHDAGKAADQMGKKFEGVGGRVRAAGGHFRAFAASAAGAFAAVGAGVLVQAAGNAIKSAAAIGVMAQQVGVTGEELQKFRVIAEQTSVDQAAMDGALKTLTQTVGKAAEGSKPAIAAFERLGINIRDAAGNIRPTGELLPLIADQLNKIPDPATRAAIATAIFGENGQKIAPMLNLGAEAMARLGQAAEDAGDILTEEEIKEAIELNAAWEKLSRTLSTRFQKAVLGAADALRDASAWMDGWAAKVAEQITSLPAQIDGYAAKVKAGIDSLGDALGGVASAAGAMASQAVSAFGRMVSGIGTWINSRLSGVLEGAKARIKAVGDWFQALGQRVVFGSIVPDMVDGIGRHMQRLEALMVGPARSAAEGTAAAFADLQRRVGSLLDRLFPEEGRYLQFVADMKTIEEGARKLGLSADEAAEAVRRLQEEYSRDAFGEKPLFGGQTTDQLGDEAAGLASDQIEREFDQLNRSAEVWGENAKQRSAEVIEAFGQMASGVIGSVRDMVGTFKSGDVLSGIQQFLELVLNVVRALGQMGVIKLPGGGVDGARAAGGPVVPGRTYLVGENGPEFITPRRSGFVHPNGTGPGGVSVRVVPSPYFDVVVDGRARNVAAPMAGQAAIGGALGAQQALARRQRMNLAGR
jgi:hypothetical protein